MKKLKFWTEEVLTIGLFLFLLAILAGVDVAGIINWVAL